MPWYDRHLDAGDEVKYDSDNVLRWLIVKQQNGMKITVEKRPNQTWIPIIKFHIHATDKDSKPKTVFGSNQSFFPRITSDDHVVRIDVDIPKSFDGVLYIHASIDTFSPLEIALPWWPSEVGAPAGAYLEGALPKSPLKARQRRRSVGKDPLEADGDVSL